MHPNEDIKHQTTMDKYILQNFDNLTKDVQDLWRSFIKVEAQLETLVKLFEKYSENVDCLKKCHHKDTDHLIVEIANLKGLTNSSIVAIHDRLNKAELDCLKEKLLEEKTRKTAPRLGLTKKSILEKFIPIGIMYALFRLIENNVRAVLDFAGKVTGLE